MRSTLPMLLVGAIGLSATNGAVAQNFDQVRSQLAAHVGSAPVAIGADINYQSKQRDSDAVASRLSLNARHDNAGLSLTVPPAILQQAQAEAADPDPDAPEPTLRALERFGPTQMGAYLDPLPQLLRRLENATNAELVVAESGEHIWTFDVDVPLGEQARKYVKDMSSQGRLVLDKDGWPVSSEFSYAMKGRAMMVVNFSQSEQHIYRYQRIGDRLIITEHQFNRANEGGGDSSQSFADVVIKAL